MCVGQCFGAVVIGTGFSSLVTMEEVLVMRFYQAMRLYEGKGVYLMIIQCCNFKMFFSYQSSYKHETVSSSEGLSIHILCDHLGSQSFEFPMYRDSGLRCSSSKFYRFTICEVLRSQIIEFHFDSSE
jgi:hypothetical protein